MSKSFQLDSVSMSNFFQFNFCEHYFSSGEEGAETKGQEIFLVSRRGLYLARVVALEVCDWLKCREVFKWLANDAGASLTVSVSGRSNTSGSLLKQWNFHYLGLFYKFSGTDFD